MTPAVELRHISKSFGPVQANRDVSLTIAKGSIHGLVGENGAGKSTLMSILYGFYEADAGEILIDGVARAIRSSQDAIAAGIGMVHQHFMLVGPFTVLENVVLGAEGGALVGAGERRLRAELARLGRDYGLEVDPDARVETLSVGLQQRVEILKALVRGADILILDEPTAVLTPAEADHLFRMLATLRDQGKTVVLVTHKLREVMAITDQVTVMRRGEVVATLPTRETSTQALAELMVGRRVLLRVERTPARPGPVVLEVDRVSVADGQGRLLVDGASLEVRAGEIVGIAGVAGNGQSELVEAIAGIRPLAGGAVRVNGEALPPGGEAGALARRLGLAHVPEDRHRAGLVTAFQGFENMILGLHREPRWRSGPLLRHDVMRGHAARAIEAYDVRPRNCLLKTANFSGGNQQKLVLAREIEQDPRVLVIGQPTRGVDIGAIEFIHRRLVALRDAGKAILLVSVELDEIFALADRILVMCGGRIVGERAAAEAGEQEIGLMMAGIGQAA